MHQSFWLYKGWRDYLFQELFFFMSFDTILLFFVFLPSLVLSVVDVIVKTGEGALEVFQLLLENCQEPENKGDLSISVIAISYGKNNNDDGSVVENNLCLTLMFEFFLSVKVFKIIHNFCYRTWPNAKWSAKDIYSYHGELFLN